MQRVWISSDKWTSCVKKLLFCAGKSKSWMRVTVLIGCYSLCSSMLLILNKVAVTYVPAPSFILACQLGSCALFVKTMAIFGAVEAEPLQYEKAKKFALIVFGFIGTLFASVTSLKVPLTLHFLWSISSSLEPYSLYPQQLSISKRPKKGKESSHQFVQSCTLQRSLKILLIFFLFSLGHRMLKAWLMIWILQKQL